MPAKPLIVSLATAWGPKYGGINAFNVELMRSLGIQPWRAFDLVCFVLQANDEDRSDAKRHFVELHDLGMVGKEFPEDAADKIAAALSNSLLDRGCIWLGHDTKSGHLALQLKDHYPDSKVVLIHHMAFGAYQDFKKGNSGEAIKKRDAQRQMFSRADLCLTVGPMLFKQLKTLLSTEPDCPPVEMLVPGLAEPDPRKVRIGDEAPPIFTAFVAGRLSAEDDRIKQGTLAVEAFGEAVATAFKPGNDGHPMRSSPTLCMRGVPDEDHDSIKKILESACQGVLNCRLADYTEDRTAYFKDLAGSSVALMPSWHEGFGLVAWEAIACKVPVVIGEQSGVYLLLNENCQGAGLNRDKSVQSVNICGQTGSDTESSHTKQDVSKVAEAILTIGKNIERSKRNAVELRRILDLQGYTWKGCADTLATDIETHLESILRKETETVATSSTIRTEASNEAKFQPEPPAATNIPLFLRPPIPRTWRVDAGLAPSALLMARDQIAHFRPERNEIVKTFLSWATNNTNRVGLQVLCGPGGMGKTRTALEILNRSGEWQRLWLGNELPENWQEQWTNWLKSNQGKRAWLIIDYADTRQEDMLILLNLALEHARNGHGPNALRILMLTRHLGWWNELTHHPDCTHDVAEFLTSSSNAGIHELPPWRNDQKSRADAYRAALEDYAAAQGRAVPEYAYIPDLTSTTFDRPLYLHLAALAALDGERPDHAESLLQSQLNREWHYWLMQHGSKLTSYDDWADALAWLGLVQGATIERADAAFHELEIASTGLAGVLAESYPGDKGFITSLQPDLLVEALLRERLAAHRGQNLLAAAMPQEDAAMSTASLNVIARFVLTSPDDSPHLRQVVQNSLARVWPHHSQTLVDMAHTTEIGFSHVLLAAWEGLPESTQKTIASNLSLPAYSSPLIGLSVAIGRTRLRSASTADERASSLNNLAIRLSERGDAASRSEALKCAREAMDTYRKLAKDQPAAYLPDLARSLNTIANRLSEQGDAASRSEALKCAREAMETYRKLATDQPAAYLPDLAMSLNNLASHLSEQGDAASRSEALKCAREAEAIIKKLK